jgi:hypothetical protein
LKSWGLDCEDENSSISLEVYERMYEDSFLIGGKTLQLFIMMIIDSVDDEFYLKLDLWEDIKYKWCTYCLKPGDRTKTVVPMLHLGNHKSRSLK